MNPHCCGHRPNYTLQRNNMNPHCCGHPRDNTLQCNSVNPHCCGHPPDHTLQENVVKLHCCGHPPDHPLQGNIVNPQQFGFTMSPCRLQSAPPASWSRRCLSCLISYALVLHFGVQLKHTEVRNLSISYGEESGLLICRDVSLVRSPHLWRLFIGQGFSEMSTDPSAFFGRVTQHSDNEYSISQDVIYLLELLCMSYITSWLRLIAVSVTWCSNGVLIWSRKWPYSHSKLECAEIRPVSTLHKILLDAFSHLACCVFIFVVF
jgi:hypothetical protein